MSILSSLDYSRIRWFATKLLKCISPILWICCHTSVFERKDPDPSKVASFWGPIDTFGIYNAAWPFPFYLEESLLNLWVVGSIKIIYLNAPDSDHWISQILPRLKSKIDAFSPLLGDVTKKLMESNHEAERFEDVVIVFGFPGPLQGYFKDVVECGILIGQSEKTEKYWKVLQHIYSHMIISHKSYNSSSKNQVRLQFSSCSCQKKTRTSNLTWIHSPKLR